MARSTTGRLRKNSADSTSDDAWESCAREKGGTDSSKLGNVRLVEGENVEKREKKGIARN